MQLFVDESRRRSYLLVSCALESSHLERTRTLLRSLRMRGERRLHFQAERDSRRREVLATLVSARLRTRVYTGRGRPEDVRGACLTQLVADARKLGCRRLVIESRGPHMDRLDRRTVARAAEALAPSPPRADFTYEHMAPHEEPALWISDAVAWCYGAGGTWQTRVMSLVESVTDVGRFPR